MVSWLVGHLADLLQKFVQQTAPTIFHQFQPTLCELLACVDVCYILFVSIDYSFLKLHSIGLNMGVDRLCSELWQLQPNLMRVMFTMSRCV